MQRILGWLRGRVVYVLILAPILLCVFYVYTFGVNAIWADQCDGMLPLFEKWYAGTLSFADFWALYYEHRHVVPRLIMLVLGLWTNWNVMAELGLIQLIVVFNLLLVLAVFRRQCVSASQLWLMLPLAFLATSLRQSENLLFGWQIVFMLTVAAALGAFFCLHLMNDPRRLKQKLAGAIAAATVATYSAAFGLLVWPVGLMPLLLLPLTRRKKLILAAIWLALGAVEWGAYFYGYAKPSLHPDISFSWEYLATIIGAALFPIASLATVGGVVLLVLAVFSAILALRDGMGSRYSFWLAAIALGLLTQAVTTLARSAFGAEQAISPRYATFSLLVVIGVYGILSGLCIEKRSHFPFVLWGSVATLVVVGLVLSTVDGYAMGVVFRDTAQYRAFLFCTSQSQPDAAISTSRHVQAADIRRGIEFLQKRHWNIFASDALASRYAMPDASLPTLPVLAGGKISQPQFDKESGLITIAGWAVNDTANDVVGGVFMEIDGVCYPAYYGVNRNDVASGLKNDKIKCCGFMRSFSAAQFGGGRHQLRIKVLTKDRAAFYTPSGPFEFGGGG